MSQQNVTVKISEHRKQILSANFGLFLHKKPRKRPVLQAATSFFAGDVFEDEGFLVFVQSIELTQLVGDGRVMFQLSKNEVEILRTKISSTNYSPKSRSLPYAFTEKGLYMLATILKSKSAVNTTFAIIETFAAVRELKRELVELHKGDNGEDKHSKMQQFGEILSDIVMPDLETTESSLELNFIIGKIKHSVKRVKRQESQRQSCD